MIPVGREAGGPAGRGHEDAQPRWARIKGLYRFVFHRKSRTATPSSYEGCFVPDLRGFCVNCRFRPDPLEPGICMCNDPNLSATRARARVARTRGNDS